MHVVDAALLRSVDHDVEDSLQEVEDEGPEAEDDGAKPQEEAGVGLGVVEGGGELDCVEQEVEQRQAGPRVHVQQQLCRLPSQLALLSAISAVATYAFRFTSLVNSSSNKPSISFSLISSNSLLCSCNFFQFSSSRFFSSSLDKTVLLPWVPAVKLKICSMVSVLILLLMA